MKTKDKLITLLQLLLVHNDLQKSIDFVYNDYRNSSARLWAMSDDPIKLPLGVGEYLYEYSAKHYAEEAKTTASGLDEEVQRATKYYNDAKNYATATAQFNSQVNTSNKNQKSALMYAQEAKTSLDNALKSYNDAKNYAAATSAFTSLVNSANKNQKSALMYANEASGYANTAKTYMDKALEYKQDAFVSLGAAAGYMQVAQTFAESAQAASNNLTTWLSTHVATPELVLIYLDQGLLTKYLIYSVSKDDLNKPTIELQSIQLLTGKTYLLAVNSIVLEMLDCKILLSHGNIKQEFVIKNMLPLTLISPYKSGPLGIRLLSWGPQSNGPYNLIISAKLFQIDLLIM